MQVEVIDILFMSIMGFVFFGGMLSVPILLLMHFLMPRAVLEAYFRPPYFGEMEVELFTGIPYAPMRTIMLMWVLAFPKYGKKRNLTEAYLLAPQWYRNLSRVVTLSFILVWLGIMFSCFLSVVYLFFTDQLHLLFTD